MLRLSCVIHGPIYVRFIYLFIFENQRAPAEVSVFVKLWSLVITTWNFFSAFVGSLALGMTWLAIPLPGYLCDRIGCRVTNFIGGTLCVTGLVLTSFSHSLNRMYFTHTLVFGFGVCFIYNCSYLVIAQNFKENLSMATGIVALGASVGVLFTGPLLQVLLDSFGWRNTYRVVAACFTLVCILSLTYNPKVQKITHTKLLSSSEDRASDKRSGISLYWGVWAFPTFAASVMSFMFGRLGMYIPYIYLVSFLPVFPLFEYYFTATSLLRQSH